MSARSRALPPISSSEVARKVAKMRGKITKRAVDTLEDGFLGPGATRLRRARPQWQQALLAEVPERRQAALVHHRSAWFALDTGASPQGSKRILGELATGRAPADKTQATVAKAIDGFVEAHAVTCAQAIKPPGCCAGMWQIGGAAGKLHRLRIAT